MKIFRKKSLTFLLVVNVLMLIVIAISLPKLPPVVPLYYGRPAGIDQLAPREVLFVPALLILLLTGIGTALSARIKDSFIETSFTWTSIVITTLSAITVLRIMLLVGNF